MLVAALQAAKINIAGIVDADPILAGQKILDVPILGDDTLIEGYDAGSINLVNGIGSTGVSKRRREIFEHYSTKCYRFADVIHPSAIIDTDASIDEGVQIMAGAIVQAGCKIGRNTIINTGAQIDHDCTIGAHCHIAPGAILCGGVVVGAGSHVGAGATILQNIRLGNGSMVRAASLVATSVPETGESSDRMGTQ